MKDHHKIRLLRLMRNLSQESVAFELAISQNTYSRIERGEITLREDRKLKILQLMQMTLADFNALVFDHTEDNDVSRPNVPTQIQSHKPNVAIAQHDAHVQNLLIENTWLREQNTQLLMLLNTYIKNKSE